MPTIANEAVPGPVVQSSNCRVIGRELVKLLLDLRSWNDQTSRIVVHPFCSAMARISGNSHESASYLAWASGEIFPLDDLGAERPFSSAAGAVDAGIERRPEPRNTSVVYNTLDGAILQE